MMGIIRVESFVHNAKVNARPVILIKNVPLVTRITI